MAIHIYIYIYIYIYVFVVCISYAFYTVSGARHSFGEIPINSLTIDGKTLLQITYDFIDAHLQAGTPVYETRTVPLNN